NNNINLKSTELVGSLTRYNLDARGTEWAYGFSPGIFPDTSREFAARICEAVKVTWEPTKENTVIVNLPAMVEMSTRSLYADQ
ncbi:unnamed protein product, partial [Tuber aestivum]